MRTRAWAVRIVLGLLVFIALGAVIGAFQGSWETIGRVIGTGVVGGLAGLLAIPLMSLVDRPQWRVGAVAALCYIGLLTVLFVLGVWTMDRGMSQMGERLMMLAGICAACLLPVVASLFAIPFLSSRWLPTGVMALGAIGLILGLPLVTMANFAQWPTALEEYAIFGIALAFVALLLLGALGRSPREARLPGILLSIPPITTLAVVGNELFLNGVLILRRLLPSDDASLAMLWAGSAALVVWRVLRLIDLRGHQRHLRTGFVASSLLGALIFGFLPSSLASDGLGAAMLVVAACHLIAIALFARMNRRAELTTQLAEVEPGTMTCPRCRELLVLRPGQGNCAACGLVYRLEMEPARCRRCHHDVTHSSSEVCTECGEPIRLTPKS